MQCMKILLFLTSKKAERLLLKKDQNFFLNFKVKDEPDEEEVPNYEYVELTPDKPSN